MTIKRPARTSGSRPARVRGVKTRLTSKEPDRAEATKVRQAESAYFRTGPDVFFESRIITLVPEDAISTQFPFPMLRRALRHSGEPSTSLECDIEVTVLLSNWPSSAPCIDTSAATVVRADFRDKFD